MSSPAVMLDEGHLMSCNHMNGGGGRRRGRRRSLKTCKANNDQVQGLGIEVVVHNGCPASATKTSRSPPFGPPNGTKPPCMMNGDINHAYKDKSGGELPQKTLKEKEAIILDVSDAPAVGIHGRAAFSIPGGAAMNGSISLDAGARSRKSDQTASEFNRTAAARRKKKKARERRGKANPPHVQIEEEDWEKEIEELALTNSKMLRDETPYGPEDVIHFPSQGMTWAQARTESYGPCWLYPKPIPWQRSDCRRRPVEPGQFEDADE